MNKKRIYKNILIFSIILLSYVALLVTVTNSGVTQGEGINRHGVAGGEINTSRDSISLPDADFEEIIFNRHVITTD